MQTIELDKIASITCEKNSPNKWLYRLPNRMCSVHEQTPVPLHASSSQSDKVRVGGHRQHQHLHQELLPPLDTLMHQLLHHHHMLIGNALQEQMNILSCGINHEVDP
jgi:hypothetical protein